MAAEIKKEQHVKKELLGDDEDDGDMLLGHVPECILKRVNALKNLQLKMIDIESKFYEELHLLECKYAPMYQPLLEQREKIVSGQYEPNDEEAKWKFDQVDPAKAIDPAKDLADELKNKATIDENKTNGHGKEDEIKGIPEFWLQTFKCSTLISDMIQPHDESVLSHLRDVRVVLHDKRPYGYTLEFHFDENEFFTNKVLTKSYELNVEPDAEDPFAYEGPNLVRCKGCAIDWHKGQNVTMRVIKKKQKHKSSGSVRVVNKEVKQDSFFNFFDMDSSAKKENKKKDDEDDEEEDDEDESLLAADFEIGHFFKECIIPKATLYFSGEVADGDEDEEDDEEMYGDVDDDDEDDEEDDYDEEMYDEQDEPPKANKNKTKTSPKKK
jgi:hypothetical protein